MLTKSTYMKLWHTFIDSRNQLARLVEFEATNTTIWSVFYFDTWIARTELQNLHTILWTLLSMLVLQRGHFPRSSVLTASIALPHLALLHTTSTSSPFWCPKSPCLSVPTLKRWVTPCLSMLCWSRPIFLRFLTFLHVLSSFQGQIYSNLDQSILIS